MQKIFLEKIINDVGVDNTNKLLSKMKNKTYPQFTFKSGQSTQCFKDGIIKKRWSIYTLKVGLCMIQWTNSRTHELIDDIEACNCDSDKKEQKYFTLNGLTYYWITINNNIDNTPTPDIKINL